jgi:hypothetical protein
VLDTDVAGLAAGPFVAACSLLAIAGATKIVRPRPTRAAIAAAGWRVPTAAAIAFGVVEIALGVAGLAFGGGAALAVAAGYLALAGFAFLLVRRAPATPCACLGASSAPASLVHVFIDLGAAGVAIAAATGGSPFSVLDGHPIQSVLFVALVGCCIELVALAFGSLPLLQRAVKERAS